VSAGPVARLRDIDDGFSLVELMISMALMSIVTIISATGFVQMFRTTALTETAAQTQTSTLLSFSKLDRDVRYAERINAPYTRTNGDFAVDFVMRDDQGVARCVRLTLPAAGGVLTRLQWPWAAPPAGSTTPPPPPAGVSPATVALDIRSANAPSTPFTLIAAGTQSSNFDRLQVQLQSSIGVTGAGATRTFDLRFTALNTVPATTTLTCSQA